MEQILNKLIELGLKRLEARIYVYLSKQGPRNEKELIYALNIDEQQLHQSLLNLQEKGFVISEAEYQAIFVAVPLENIIDNVVSAKTDEIQRMEKDKENYLANLKS